LTLPLGVTPLEFTEIFGIRKLESLGYHMALFGRQLLTLTLSAYTGQSFSSF